MRIWIDLANSPHPLLFEPVVDVLRADGHEVSLTARDNAQTVELARRRWSDVEVIGGESPRGRARKAITLGRRVGELVRWARSWRPDVAVSHNSYAQIVAAKLARVAVVTAMDFEHQPANHLAFRLADVVLLPEAMRPLDVARQGARPSKTRFYPGLKEELYLGSFTPDPSVDESLGVSIGQGETLVVARTPPSRALYHGVDNALFPAALKACERQGAQVVALVRHPEQREQLEALGLGRLTVPRKAIDSRSLMYGADLVIGAGGTMTREAALLGVPTWTVFAGRRPAVDRWLEAEGRMRRLNSADELEVRPRKEEPVHASELARRSEFLIEHFTAAATLSAPPAARTADDVTLIGART
jgi:hypothetical protein